MNKEQFLRGAIINLERNNDELKLQIAKALSEKSKLETLRAKVASADVLVEALEELLPAYRKVVKLYDSNHDDAYTVKAHNALAKTRSIK